MKENLMPRFMLAVGLLLGGAWSGIAAAADNADVHIIPRPVKVERNESSYTLSPETRILVDKGSAGAGNIGELLASWLRPATGYPLPVTVVEKVKGEIQPIMLTTKNADNSLGAEGYELLIKPKAILVRAPSPAGLFYGIVSLRQLLPSEIESRKKVNGVEWSAACVRISDQPRFPWRGMHLDVCRHYFPKQVIKNYIDYLALHKFNTFHWHLTEDQGWRIEIKKYPKLTEEGAIRSESPVVGNRNKGDGTPYGPYFYTQDEVREIVAYARERHITVVPEIEMPGHSLGAITAYPELGCTGGPYKVRTRWGVEPDIFCAGNEKVFSFLEDVLTEVLALFPSEYIHIGGDEAPKTRWKKCSKCQARIKSEGLHDEHELQSWFIQRIEKFLNSKGRRLIGWDEILEGGLAPNASVMSWRGERGGIAAARSGHTVVMTPNSHCYFDHYQGKPANEPEAIGGFLPLEKVYGYEPIPAVLSPEEAGKVLGAQANVWTEYIHNGKQVEYMAMPRMCALAEVVWSPASHRDYPDFLNRLDNLLVRLDWMGANYRMQPPAVDANAVLFREKAEVRFVKPASDKKVIRYTLDGSAPTEESPVYDDPIHVAESLKVTAAIFGSDGQKSPITVVDCVQFSGGAPKDLEPGLHAMYAQGTWERIPNFRFLPDVKVKKVDRIDLDPRERDDGYALQFNGHLRIEQSGTYRFFTASDDGSRLSLGGARVVDNDRSHAYEEKSGTVYLEKGLYPLEVAYFEIGGADGLQVSMQGPGMPKQKLPDRLLFRSRSQPPLKSASIETSLPTYKDFVPGQAFDGDTGTFFWAARAPKNNDHFTVAFDQPRRVDRIEVITGKTDGGDALDPGVLEVSVNGSTFEQIVAFQNGKADGRLKHPAIKAVRIRATGGSSFWLAIREIIIHETAADQSLSGAANFDVHEVPDLKSWAVKAQNLAEEHYPRIAAKLHSDGFVPPRQIALFFSRDMKGVAHTSGNRIKIAAPWIKAHPNDFGMVIHEMTHVIQSYPRPHPSWLTEGIADYVRFFMFEPPINRPKVHPDRSKYTDGYRTTAAFLAWIQASYDGEIVTELNRALREQQFTKDLFRERTGHDLEQLWTKFTDSLRGRA